MSFTYSGSELELFAQASHWKQYWSAAIRPLLGPRVLEVGAGVGANIPFLFTPPAREWVALEPDARLAQQIARGIASSTLPRGTQVVIGTIGSMDGAGLFDAILYIDVLEHILEDAAELQHAAELLAPNGRLIVLVPAHGYLYSAFDVSIGHHRRYSRAMLCATGPAGCRLHRMQELDSVGLLASLANRILLRQDMPSPRQIATWDRYMVPVSRCLDPWLGYGIGKSILAVWRRDA